MASETAPPQLLGVPHEDQATQLLHMCRRPRSLPFSCCLVGFLVCVSPYGPRLVDSVGFLIVPLTPLAPSSFLSSRRFPEFCLIFGDVSVSISCWVKRGQLCYTPLFKNRSISSIVSGVGLAHDMSLKLGQALVGHYLNFYSIFIAAHLVQKILWIEDFVCGGWCPHTSI